MKIVKMLVTVVAGTVLATGAFAQSAKEVRGASPYVAVENEPSPKLIVDPPLPQWLVQGVFCTQDNEVRDRRPSDPSGMLNMSFLLLSETSLETFFL